MINQTAIQKAKDHFGRLLENQMLRMEKIKSAPDWIDYRQLSPIKMLVHFARRWDRALHCH